MDRERNNPEDRGRLGRQGDGDAGRGNSDPNRGFGDGSSDRPHPPEQYPGGRSADDRDYNDRSRDDRDYDERGYSQTNRTDDGYGRQSYQEERRSGGKGWGIAALIISVLAFLSAFLFAFFNLILAIPGLILGIVARRKGSRGLGLAAIIISILAILLGIIVTVALGAVLLNSPEFQQILQEAQQQ